MSNQDTQSDVMSGPARAGMLSAGLVVVLYVIELVDTVLSGRLDQFGVHPRSIGGLDGIVFAPLLHSGWGHLFANTVPLLVLGFLVAMSGTRTWLLVTAVVWVVGDAGVWLFAGSGTDHVGASALVFGWLAYLAVRGVFTRSIGQIALGLVVLASYGGVLWGVLPGRPGVSWQGHLFGALAGGLAAWLLAEHDVDEV